jgi:carboxymethylenebutenolidase
MCDDITLKQWTDYLRDHPPLSRRVFGALSAGAGVAAVLPRAANAQSVVESDVEIETPDGTADCYFVHPAAGATAAVLVWPDIMGLRTAFRDMGKRLAESGYSVLVVNPFYRSARAPVVPDGVAFGDPRANVVREYAGELNRETHITDARTFVDWIARWARRVIAWAVRWSCTRPMRVPIVSVPAQLSMAAGSRAVLTN